MGPILEEAEGKRTSALFIWVQIWIGKMQLYITFVECLQGMGRYLVSFLHGTSNHSIMVDYAIIVSREGIPGKIISF